MDSFDDFKRQLNQPADQLPEGFGWEDMQEGIYEKMPQKRKRRKGLFFFLSSLIVLIGLGSFYLYYPFDTSAEELEIETKSAQENDRIQKESDPVNYANTEQQTISPLESKAKVSSAHAEKLLAQNQLNSIGLKAPSLQKPHLKPETTSTNNRTTSKLSLSSIHQNNHQLNIQEVAVFNPSLEENKAQTPANATSISSESKVQVLARLSSKATPLFSDNSALFNITDLPAEFFNHQKQPLKSTNPHTNHTDKISLSFIGNGFSRSRATNNPSVKPWWGSGLGVGYEHKLAKKWSLRATAQVQRLKEEFSFANRDTIVGPELVNQDVHIFDHNNLLLRTSSRAQQQLLDRQRRELAYNYLDVLDLSIGAKYDFSKNGQGLHAGLDLGATIRINASGKQFDNAGEIISIDENETFRNQTAGLITPHIGYTFNLASSVQLELASGLQYRYAVGMPTTERFAPFNAYASAGFSWAIK